MATEAEFKRLIAGAMRAEGWIVFSHEDKMQRDVPDLSLTGPSKVAWIEVKTVTLERGTFDGDPDEVRRFFDFEPLTHGGTKAKLRLSQIEIMRRLESKIGALARFAFAFTDGKRSRYSLVSPQTVHEIVEKTARTPISMTKLDRVVDYLKTEEMR